MLLIVLFAEISDFTRKSTGDVAVKQETVLLLVVVLDTGTKRRSQVIVLQIQKQSKSFINA